MRITSRLRIISAVSIAMLIVLAAALIWSFAEFRRAKDDYVLADAIKVNYFERTSLRDQYFLYREDRVRKQWDKNKEISDQMLRQAETQFQDEESHKNLERLHRNIEDSAVIFHRIADNTEATKTASGNHETYEELDKRLFSQLLLKAAAVRNAATTLEDASARHVEQTYKHLAAIITLFAITLALATFLTSTHLGRLIRKRLEPLHDGAKIIADGNLDYRIKSDGTDEFSELALSINTMTDKLQAFTRQLEAQIISHEQIELALSDSDSRLRDSILNSSNPIMIHAEDGEVLMLSKAWTSITGYGLEDIPTTRIWTDKAYGAQAETIEDYIEALYGLQDVRKEGEYAVRTASGETRLWDFQSQPLKRLPDGRRVVLSLATDITDRKRTEDELHKLSTAVEQSPASVVITDTEANIQYVNPRFTEVTGYTAAEAIGRNPRILQSGQTAKEIYQELWGKLTHGQAWHGELFNKRKNGECYWEETHVAPVKNESGAITHYVAVKIDITKRKQAEQALKKESEKNLALLRNASDGIYILDTEGNVIEASDSFCAMLGYRRDEVIGMNVSQWDAQFTDADHTQAIRQQFAQARRSIFTTRHRRKDGSIFDAEVSGFPLELEEKPVLFNSSRDITERKVAEEKVHRSETRLRAILDNVPYLVWLKDIDGRFIAVNKAFFNTTGLAQIQDVLGKTDFDLWPEELAKKYRADDAEVISTRRQKLTEEMSMDNGEVHWVETFKAPITDMDDNLLGTTGFAQDITGRKSAEVKIRHLAHYDPLTDLPNRTLFSDRLQQALATAKREKTHIALMFLDLDRFKPINDELGHHVGDLLLKEAAKRMQDCVRESDTVARIGGDEFVILLPTIEVERDAMLVAEKIRHALNQPFALVGHSLNISSSTGIAVYPKHGMDEMQLVKNADIAMYHAKEGGRNNVVLYQPSMRNDR